MAIFMKLQQIGHRYVLNENLFCYSPQLNTIGYSLYLYVEC